MYDQRGLSARKTISKKKLFENLKGFDPDKNLFDYIRPQILYTYLCSLLRLVSHKISSENARKLQNVAIKTN